MTKRKEYVVGFVFNSDRDLVLLVRKERPDWQKGFLNGVGGLIEPEEGAYEAMVRECKEEAGLVLTGWEEFCRLSGKDYIVYFFKNFVSDKKLSLFKNLTDERLEIWNYPFIITRNKQILPDLLWLLPLALRNGVKVSGTSSE